MAAKALYRHFEIYVTSFEKHYNKLLQKLKTERIHKLRVDVKRIRAIFKLIDFSLKQGFDLKNQEKELLELFNVAGRLREVQMNISQIEKSDSEGINQYFQHLKRKEKKAVKKLKNALEKFSLDDFKSRNLKTKSLIESLTDRRILKESKEFINKETQEIKRLQADLKDEKRFHKIRIHLKSMGAIASLLDDFMPNAGYNKLSKSIKGLGLLVGDWHDKQMLISSLRVFSEKQEHVSDGLENEIDRLKEESLKMTKIFEQDLEDCFKTQPD